MSRYNKRCHVLKNKKRHHDTRVAAHKLKVIIHCIYKIIESFPWKIIRRSWVFFTYTAVSGHLSKIKWRSSPSPTDTWPNLPSEIKKHHHYTKQTINKSPLILQFNNSKKTETYPKISARRYPKISARRCKRRRLYGSIGSNSMIPSSVLQNPINLFLAVNLIKKKRKHEINTRKKKGTQYY